LHTGSFVKKLTVNQKSLIGVRDSLFTEESPSWASSTARFFQVKYQKLIITLPLKKKGIPGVYVRPYSAGAVDVTR
jgi:hypothetical protein